MAANDTPEQLLSDIVEWSERLLEHIGTISEAEFPSDRRTQDAVVRCFEVIGEASGKLMKAFPAIEMANPDLPLREAYRTRNRLTHGYGSVDLKVVWKASQTSILDILHQARKTLAQSSH